MNLFDTAFISMVIMLQRKFGILISLRTFADAVEISNRECCNT
jgi:hypothetical protein